MASVTIPRRAGCGVATEQISVNELRISIDIQKTKSKLLRTWTRLTVSDIACYPERRSKFLTILQKKYALTKDHAETALSSIERHCSEEY